MRKLAVLVVCFGAPLLVAPAWAQSTTCAKIIYSAEALEKYPRIAEACEDVVVRNGKEYIKIRGEVRSARRNSIRIYLPALRETRVLRPAAGQTVEIAGAAIAPQDLQQGQELRFYLAVEDITDPEPQGLAYMSETTEEFTVFEASTETAAAALPTTASLWPAAGLAGSVLALLGIWLGGIRRLLDRRWGR